MCISNKLTGGADAVGLGTTHSGPLLLNAWKSSWTFPSLHSRYLPKADTLFGLNLDSFETRFTSSHLGLLI